ncbi:MAG: cupin domain-containing protein [Euryarchaeota archaeon]|nr:cupin domain-containing protein [Euryarchaeota archaeon]
MKIFKLATAPEKENHHNVLAQSMYGSEQVQVMHISLKPGESLKKHTTPTNVFFYILEGKGIVEIGEEEKEVVQDSLIESPANIPHLLRNDSDETFRFLVVKLNN